jgi:hypothetical protein
VKEREREREREAGAFTAKEDKKKRETKRPFPPLPPRPRWLCELGSVSRRQRGARSLARIRRHERRLRGDREFLSSEAAFRTYKVTGVEREPRCVIHPVTWSAFSADTRGGAFPPSLPHSLARSLARPHRRNKARGRLCNLSAPASSSPPCRTSLPRGVQLNSVNKQTRERERERETGANAQT